MYKNKSLFYCADESRTALGGSLKRVTVGSWIIRGVLNQELCTIRERVNIYVEYVYLSVYVYMYVCVLMPVELNIKHS